MRVLFFISGYGRDKAILLRTGGRLGVRGNLGAFRPQTAKRGPPAGRGMIPLHPHPAMKVGGLCKMFPREAWGYRGITAMFHAAESGCRVIVLGENTFSPRHDTPKTPGQQVDRGLSECSGAAAGRCNTSVPAAPHRNSLIFQVQAPLCTGSREELPGGGAGRIAPHRSLPHHTETR